MPEPQFIWVLQKTAVRLRRLLNKQESSAQVHWSENKRLLMSKDLAETVCNVSSTDVLKHSCGLKRGAVKTLLIKFCYFTTIYIANFIAIMSIWVLSCRVTTWTLPLLRHKSCHIYHDVGISDELSCSLSRNPQLIKGRAATNKVEEIIHVTKVQVTLRDVHRHWTALCTFQQDWANAVCCIITVAVPHIRVDPEVILWWVWADAHVDRHAAVKQGHFEPLLSVL